MKAVAREKRGEVEEEPRRSKRLNRAGSHLLWKRKAVLRVAPFY
jgi:hypothetical protein